MGIQGAFLPYRQIEDNILIAHECVKKIVSKKSRQQGYTLKVVMSKAYDQLRWDYLYAIQQRMDFDQLWGFVQDDLGGF